MNHIINLIKKYIWLLCALKINLLLPYAQEKPALIIITPTSNHPEYIIWQNKCFKKYLKDKYEFIIFNDATDEMLKQQIDETCQMLNIKSIQVSQKNRPIGTVYSWASYRHGQALNYLMNTIGFDHNGIVAIVDSDMFLIKDFSIIDYLEGYDIAGVARGPENNDQAYIWPGLIFFNINTLPDKKKITLSPNDSLGFDTGGELSQYLQKHPTIKKRFFDYGRLKLGIFNHPLYVLSEPNRGDYLHCSNCKTKIQNKKKSQNISCSHREEILRELNFRDSVNNLINADQIPCGAEFILGDTFFHLSGGSEYYEKSAELIHHNTTKMNYFLTHLLQ